MLPALLALMWNSFTAYPAARQLCSEHVAGNSMHIDWTSYATKDAPDKVVAFYEKDQGRKVEKSGEKDGAVFLHAKANDDDVVTIVPARGGTFGHCSVEPTQDEMTLIVVSRAYRSK